MTDKMKEIYGIIKEITYDDMVDGKWYGIHSGKIVETKFTERFLIRYAFGIAIMRDRTKDKTHISEFNEFTDEEINDLIQQLKK